MHIYSLPIHLLVLAIDWNGSYVSYIFGLWKILHALKPIAIHTVFGAQCHPYIHHYYYAVYEIPSSAKRGLYVPIIEAVETPTPTFHSYLPF